VILAGISGLSLSKAEGADQDIILLVEQIRISFMNERKFLFFDINEKTRDMQ
jgi:hypothetical protein